MTCGNDEATSLTQQVDYRAEVKIGMVCGKLCVDVGGMATDIGLLGISATMGRLRGRALGMGDLLSGSRFLRGFIVPGGVRLLGDKFLSQMKTQVAMLRHELKAPIKMFLENQMALERMKEIGVLSNSLANEFGMVGAALRATGVGGCGQRQRSHDQSGQEHMSLQHRILRASTNSLHD